ncbi:hypothetical protein [Pseudomonas sp. I3-I5]|uniref:hypothetical protein n=1 Tax=Pseudomonas sp. I3-I5 TaxID=2926671 RepID=UPI001F6017FA|nr:hypothetical protein [Pseudomonas sp. I3-I5]UNT15803.1 hypothetical protein MOP87_06920 [Pseudomonas sp. I3-I5]
MELLTGNATVNDGLTLRWVGFVDRLQSYETAMEAPVSVRKHQVVMVIGDPQEETPILDPVQLQQHPSILEEQIAASRRSTERAVEQADKAMKRFQKAEETKAK